ncbi:hypothetical protein SAMN05216566_11290 [Aureimonas phyllosphaerae]|uniref:Uncharacterized protein n=1 Tax=Aureimonas phyllosphaerae TaxID=1166078 RepID=A0A7W6BUX1_9HYPH|nr:hypothetical protein [Aureimonas phyllosphaerae]MBB3961379.1 hypothetical protein [Aureimonas phyllosphaerae]SFF42412.1 hypothetical protein SAMN05216566_11290 [Aureimonas phyllosphaerae]
MSSRDGVGPPIEVRADVDELAVPERERLVGRMSCKADARVTACEVSTAIVLASPDPASARPETGVDGMDGAVGLSCSKDASPFISLNVAGKQHKREAREWSRRKLSFEASEAAYVRVFPGDTRLNGTGRRSRSPIATAMRTFGEPRLATLSMALAAACTGNPNNLMRLSEALPFSLHRDCAGAQVWPFSGGISVQNSDADQASVLQAV